MREKVGELFGDALDMGRSGYNGSARGGGERKKTIPCGLDQRTAFESEIEQELRVVFTGERP